MEEKKEQASSDRLINKPDIPLKNLMDHKDVLADILNYYLFKGKVVARESEISVDQTRSSFTVDDEWHWQDRDVLFTWDDTPFRIVSLGVENQSYVDEDMILRIIGYDGASYKKQYSDIKSKKLEYPYPVITLVLYYGDGNWSGTLSLKKLMTKSKKASKIRQETLDRMSDYTAEVINLSRLSREDVERFESDFFFLTDYLVQIQQNGYYVAPKKEARHMTDTLYALKEISGDERFIEALDHRKGDNIMANRIVPFYSQETFERIQKAKAEGITEGRALEKIEYNKALEQAVDYLTAAGRENEIRKLITDQNFRSQIFEEAGIEAKNDTAPQA